MNTHIEKPTKLWISFYEGSHCFYSGQVAALRANTLKENAIRSEEIRRKKGGGIKNFSVHLSTGPEVNDGHSPFVIQR